MINKLNKETMDEHMEIVEEVMIADDSSFPDDIDFEYEFDVYQVFDFTRDETQSEAAEAESWFRYAHEYPPSPFIEKLKMMKAAKSNNTKVNKTSSKKKEADKNTHTSMSIDPVAKHHNHTPQDNTKGKSKSKSTVNSPKPSGSSFMKPTASHLAKQNKECDNHSGGYGRLQKPAVNAVEKLRPPIIIQSQATKRQKLEIGYLRKATQLKHRATYSHKITSKGTQMEANSKSRVNTNTPQKPSLITEEKAQMHRPQNKSEPVQQPKANNRATNKKMIIDTPNLPQRKKTTNPTEFQESHLKTSVQAMQVESANVLNKQNSAPPVSQNSGKKDKSKSSNNNKKCNYEKVHPIKDGEFTLNSKRNSQLPPTDLFKKLSLKAEPETKVISSKKQPRVTKSPKENVPKSFQQDFRRCAGKPNHCGPDWMITEVKT